MRKFFDTCMLLNSIGSISTTDEWFYISTISLSELENIKTSAHKDEETKYNARIVLHWLKDNRDKWEVASALDIFDYYLNSYNLPDTNDSKIIASALFIQQQTKEPIVFCTDDLACALLAESAGLSVQMSEDENDNYTGFYTLICNDDELAEFYSNDFANNINRFGLVDNQYLIIKDMNNKIIDKYKWHEDKYNKIIYRKFESDFFGKVAPMEDFQQIAMDSLANNQITMLRGSAGTGKSYLAFGYMFNLLEQSKIDKIIVFCNTVATKGSAKLGFYPGSRTEKLLDSQIGNLLESKLGDRMIVEKLIYDGLLVLLPMSDIRGYDTSNMNAAIYISEAQNLDIELMKLALQRIGADSICILDGDDCTQVDMSMYAGSRNGMKRASKVFRGQDFYGEVKLQKIQRSKIAEIADLM